MSHVYIDVHKCLSLNHRKIRRPELSFGLIYYLLLITQQTLENDTDYTHERAAVTVLQCSSDIKLILVQVRVGLLSNKLKMTRICGG